MRRYVYVSDTLRMVWLEHHVGGGFILHRARAYEPGGERVSTPKPPPTRAPYEPSAAMTCVPSDAYVLGVTTRRPSGACSASTYDCS